MTATKRKPSKKKNAGISTENAIWTRVGTLPKKTSFSFNSKRSPADSLIKRIKKLLPDVQSISEVGCSPKTNEFLRKELVKYAKRHTYYRGRSLDTAIGFTMLDYSPCDIPGAEDFVLYYRSLDTELLGK